MSFSSATKYFSGHSDAMGGPKIRRFLKKKKKAFYKFQGLLCKGCRLYQRIRKQNENTF